MGDLPILLQIIILAVQLILIGIFLYPFYVIIKSIIEHFRKKRRKEELRQQREKDEEERRKRKEQERIEAHKREQERIYQDLNNLGDKSLSIFESLPNYLRSVEGYLNQADYDFSDNALSPFWDSIENAYTQLGAFYDSINNIKQNLSEYERLVKQYEGKPPNFPLSRNSIEKLSESDSMSKRANQLVRKAQKNADFAHVYEMRKQNQILIAGFNNLSQVINNMGERLNSSIKDLSESIDSTSSRIDEVQTTIEAQTEEIKSSDENMEKFLREEAKRKERERQALNQLDEIHHIERKKYYGY